MKDGRPFAVAGIWENWKHPGTEDWIRTFAVITCPANSLVADIHDRMPVILLRLPMTAGCRASNLILGTCWCRTTRT